MGHRRERKGGARTPTEVMDAMGFAALNPSYALPYER
jgi:hypothetical protein